MARVSNAILYALIFVYEKQCSVIIDFEHTPSMRIKGIDSLDMRDENYLYSIPLCLSLIEKMSASVIDIQSFPPDL